MYNETMFWIKVNFKLPEWLKELGSPHSEMELIDSKNINGVQIKGEHLREVLIKHNRRMNNGTVRKNI